MVFPFAAIGAALGAAASAKSLFGGKKAAGTPGGSQSQYGYASAPPWAQNIYSGTYAPGIQSYFNSPQSGAFVPQQVEPFNRFQNEALQGLGGGIQDIQQNLGQYMNPYHSAVTDNINREADIRRSDLLGRASIGGNAAGLNNSAVGVQLGLNDEARQRLLAQANYENYQQALGLRRQTLAEMLGAGGAQQTQGQNVLNNSYNNSIANNQAGLGRLQNLGNLLSPLLGGGSQVSTNAQAPVPSFLNRLGGFATGLGQSYQQGDFSGLWNNGAPQGNMQGPPPPGFLNRFFGV
jgi:hypothetical protein